MDIIEIDNLRLRCIIGFSQHERKDLQDVVISLRLGCDMRAAARSDDPKDALNYRSLTKDVITLVEGLALAIAGDPGHGHRAHLRAGSCGRLGAGARTQARRASLLGFRGRLH